LGEGQTVRARQKGRATELVWLQRACLAKQTGCRGIETGDRSRFSELRKPDDGCTG